MVEFLASIFSLLSVILAIKENRNTWSIGIIGIVLYSYIFYNQKLYYNLGLQMLYLIQSSIGLYYWIRNKKIYGKDVNIKNGSSFIEKLSIFMLIFSIFLFSKQHDRLDILTSVLSFIACYFLIKGNLENWIFWIIADILYVYMFYTNHMYISSFLYFIFLLLAIYGYHEWRKKI